MREKGAGLGGRALQTFDPPPRCRSPALPALLALLQPVMAVLAKALQVLIIPEQPLITTMRDLMVSNQLRCVSLDAATSLHLASEEIANKNGPAQLLPPCRLIPAAPFDVLITIAQALLLITRQTTNARCKCGELRLERGEARASHILRCAKGDPKVALLISVRIT